MPVNIRIPTPLRKLTHDEEVVETSAENVGQAIADLELLTLLKYDQVLLSLSAVII